MFFRETSLKRYIVPFTVLLSQSDLLYKECRELNADCYLKKLMA